MHNNLSRIFVTGASGFIGSYLHKIISQSGYDVICIYNVHAINNSTPSIKCNLQHESLYDQFIKFKPDTIIHCAGLNPSALIKQDDSMFYQFNRDATLNLANQFLKYCESNQNKNKKKFLNLSTYEIYGNIKDLNGFNESSSTNPLNAYADSKAQAVNEIEQLVSNSVDFINVICTNNYGPGQSNDKLIPVVFNKLIKNQKIIIKGDGSSQRTWTFVKDTCEGIIQALKNGKHKRYHLSANNQISVIGVIKAIHDILKSQNFVATDSARLTWHEANNNPIFKIDSSWSEKELNWTAKTPFSMGLKHTLEYLKKQRDE
ncbi:dTDP-glucose 4,6-dehydratase [Marinicella pacifica]|uniref:dTDP-glucose 4,6-dehydratase n=1 Tax=Marinicella pacifica TaxID=1171543 RepID=A0A917CHX2_9GAMM|nr:NAD-dependent epimerase/dehydratase family protein [Marinicella pacifica]GGF87359.1 dTDP-glucose 4,6-dehydratase [Marinicella pacifica]